MSESEQFCTLFFNEYRCAISVLDVFEVLPLQRLTPVPLAPGTVAGLLNIRGQIITVLDLRPFLLGVKDPLTEDAMMVVLEREGHPLAIVVDAVGDVISTSSDELLALPETIPAPLRAVGRAIAQDGDVLTVILDVARIVAVGEAA